MAFGLTRKFAMDFKPENITDEEFLKIAVATAKKLDWNISRLNVNGFIAHTKFSFSSFGEEFSITIQDGKAELKSECVGTQMVDW